MDLKLVCVLLILFGLTFCTLNGPRAVSTLQFVIAVSKHGARAPSHTYPRDPYRNISVWPNGPGLITRVGKLQMYNVGLKLRHLYEGFLSPIYHGSQLMAQSTLVDRTIISAATLLAGLYPPQSYQKWHPNITWQPVPVYPNLLDKTLLILEPSQCPRFWHEQNTSIASLPQQDGRQHQDVYQVATEGTGRNISSFSQMYLLYQSLSAAVENHLPLPKWAEAIFLPKMVPIISSIVRHTTVRNVKMIKILNGLFLDKILEFLQQRPEMETVDQEKEHLRMLLHVGHDITILCLLAAMGIRDENIPFASTTLLFELHRNSALPSGHQLQILKIDGRANSSDVPEEVNIPICKFPCDVTTFIEKTRRYTTTDWNNECVDMSSTSD